MFHSEGLWSQRLAVEVATLKQQELKHSFALWCLKQPSSMRTESKQCKKIHKKDHINSRTDITCVSFSLSLSLSFLSLVCCDFTSSCEFPFPAALAAFRRGKSCLPGLTVAALFPPVFSFTGTPSIDYSCVDLPDKHMIPFFPEAGTPTGKLECTV